METIALLKYSPALPVPTRHMCPKQGDLWVSGIFQLSFVPFPSGV